MRCPPSLCLCHTQLISHQKMLLLDDVRSHLMLPPSQPTQKRGGGIQAKTSHSIYKVNEAVHIQRLWHSLKQQIRIRISQRIQRSCVLYAVIVLQQKMRRGKRKTPRCRTGRRHTPNAPDPILDRGGVPWCISDTTEESITFTDFDTESTEPSCMPLVYWSTKKYSSN